jgi:hypothetical protein
MTVAGRVTGPTPFEARQPSTAEQYRQAIPADSEVVHFHSPYFDVPQPSLHTVHTMGIDTGASDRNWSFVSSSHARNHGRRFALEAADAQPGSPRSAVFQKPGPALSLPRHSGRREEAGAARRSAGFPEPGRMGGTVRHGAGRGMLCGTPILATKRGAMPEIVDPATERLFETDEEFAAAPGEVSELSPPRCREVAAERFSIARTARGYIDLDRRIAGGEWLS